MPPKSKDPRRNSDLATIHMAAKGLFGDVSKGGDGREDYEDWMAQKTGKRSAGALTQQERIDLIKGMRSDGLIQSKNPGGKGAGGDRPTSAQWATIAGLARDRGWADGLEDEGLRAFIKRTCKVSSSRFITRKNASDVILGLRNWNGQAEGVPDVLPKV